MVTYSGKYVAVIGGRSHVFTACQAIGFITYIQNPSTEDLVGWVFKAAYTIWPLFGSKCTEKTTSVISSL